MIRITDVIRIVDVVKSLELSKTIIIVRIIRFTPYQIENGVHFLALRKIPPPLFSWVVGEQLGRDGPLPEHAKISGRQSSLSTMMEVSKPHMIELGNTAIYWLLRFFERC